MGWQDKGNILQKFHSDTMKLDARNRMQWDAIDDDDDLPTSVLHSNQIK